jgi:two-component system response regulator PilR (NtrC family)
VQLGFDIALTTGVVYVTGSGDSPFGFLYSLVVIHAAVLLATPGAIAVAAGSSICYAGLVGLLGSGVLPQPDYPFRPAPADLQFIARFATTNGTFFLIALLAGSLVRRLHRAEDLLDKRTAEHDRLASLHEALARNIGSALISTDAEGLVTSVNHAAEELTSTSAAELWGKDVGTIFPPLRTTATGRLQFLQSSSSVHPTEFTHRNGHESDLVLRCSAVALRDTYQNPIGALYIFQDVTKLRELEEQLQTEEIEDLLGDDPETEAAWSGDGLVGNSEAMRQVRTFIDKVSKTDATVLIGGESGTGKELVARAIHARSNRAERPFVAVNCGAIPENLIESEFFGHVKGAYTGAVNARSGWFRMADGGTIFLDEIGDLPLSLQVKLLRVLQERSFTPIGSDTHVTVDVRVIAATNRNLEEAVREQTFREDLYYRLNVLNVLLPALRDRREDISFLIRRVLRQFSELHGKSVQRLSVAAAKRLQEYEYPGNVRELENIIEHAVALCDGETVHEAHLPEYLDRQRSDVPTVPRATPAEAAEETSPPSAPDLQEISNLDDNLAQYEKSILLRALAEAGGVKTRAAGLLGINYRSFRHRLQKYGLTEAGQASVM